MERERNCGGSFKSADAAELRLISPCGRRQQVGICGDFVNLYLRAGRENGHTRRRFYSTNKHHILLSKPAMLIYVLFFRGQNEQPESNFLWWKIHRVILIEMCFVPVCAELLSFVLSLKARSTQFILDNLFTIPTNQ